MYEDLSEEEAIQLAIEFVSQAVSLPQGLKDKLGAETVEQLTQASE